MSKKVTCKICFMCDYLEAGELDNDLHKGYTIGNGKKLYWERVWHPSGNVTVYSAWSRRWLSGDTEITIHWK